MKTNTPTSPRGRRFVLGAGLAIVACMAAGALAGHLASRATASGIPKTEPLHYSGVLADASGKVLSGTYSVGLDLYKTALGGSSLCTTAPSSIAVTQGRFRLPLNSACVAVIQQNPELYVDVRVNGTSMGRQKVGAVPFAVEAQSAARVSVEADCPPGYTRDLSATGITLCKQGKDEMVKVGDHWVDRYEGSVVDAGIYNNGTCDGTGTQYGLPDPDDYPTTFPDSAKATVKLYACSSAGRTPSRNMTWFQASAACAFVGKHLCTNGEWQTAAYGTPDDSTSCNLAGASVEKTGSRTACVSLFGARDMAGNLWEWVDLWTQAGRSWATADAESVSAWPGSDFGGDYTWNVDGRTFNGSGWANGAPASARRGGNWPSGTQGGVFALDLNRAPSAYCASTGLRCCRR